MRLARVWMLTALGCSAPAPTTHVASDMVDPPFQLDASRAWYFANEWGSGAQYLELRADGTYRTIDREHMGVGEDDAGRWRQAPSGELRLCSSHRFADVDSGRLWVVVGTAETYAQLPNLARALRRMLGSGRASFGRKDVAWPLSAGDEDYSHPSVNDGDEVSGDIPRVAVTALVDTLAAYMTAGDQNLMRTVARAHHGIVYLDGSWELPHRPHDARGLASIHKDLDANQASIGVVRAVDAQTFRAEAYQTQPFVFHTEMNDLVHQTVSTVPDWKKPRIVPSCRSF